jgi:phosphatidylserine/phosphatidylglycerophosphate/cardiolipin synthase-like enzyme
MLIKVLLTTVLVLSQCLASVYPAREGNLDVLTTDDALVDLMVKVAMIDNATTSVDISGFIFGYDNLGLTVAAALRRALERGVRVRVVYESYVSRMIGDDPFLHILHLLADPTLPRQAELINMRVSEKIKTRLAVNDHVHEKLVIVDAGLSSEVIYFGGRDLSKFSLTTVDSGFFVRPLDFNRSHLGQDIVRNYNLVWSQLRNWFGLKAYQKPPSAKVIEKMKITVAPYANMSEESNRVATDMIRTLRTAPTQSLLPNQFRPKKATLIANDFLFNSLQGQQKGKMLGPNDHLIEQDDVIRFVNSELKNSKNAQITSYAGHLVPSLMNTIRDIGATTRVDLFTNGRHAMARIDNIGLGAVSYDLTEIGLNEVRESLPLGHKVNFYGADVSGMQGLLGDQITYVHRKEVLYQRLDGTKVMMTGSHNFTPSSSTKNSEIMVAFEDAALFDYAATRNGVERSSFYTPIHKTKSSFLVRCVKAVRHKLLNPVVHSQF